MDAPDAESRPRHPGGTHPLLVALGVSLLATLASHALPVDSASGGVAFVFFGATYFLCLRLGHPRPPAHYGLSLGGLMDKSALSATRVLTETSRAWFIATSVALLIFPPFWLGFLSWYEPETGFSLERAFQWEGESAPARWLLEMSLWHVLGVALPEEAFFRGYLQTSLKERWKGAVSLGPVELDWPIVVSSVVFAIGHLATSPHPSRLAVFFPSLLFGIVRRKSGGIGAAVFLHAECNLFSQFLGQGYGLY